MKIFLKITFLLVLLELFLFNNNIVFADSNYTFSDSGTTFQAKKICVGTNCTSAYNLELSWSWSIWWVDRSNSNDHLNEIHDITRNDDFSASGVRNWDQWIYNIIVRIARDLKNFVFVISTIYFLIIVFKLLLSENTEEELWNFKKWIIWISIWIVVMQVAYGFVRTLAIYNGWVIWQPFGQEVYKNIINPLISVIEIWASFVFIAIAIYAFYKMVTSNWDDEKAKSWKMTIFYAILWFIIIKVSRRIVETVYWRINCANTSDNSFFIFQNDKCIEPSNLSNFSNIILNIINWMNWFVWIITLIMVIYVWAQVFLSFWDEEKLKNGKKAIIYIIIWVLVLFTNYLILTFFFPAKPI